MLLKNKKDLKNAIIYLGIEWEKEIKDEIKTFPSVLVGFYANDIEFREIYRFSGIKISDFRQSKII